MPTAILARGDRVDLREGAWVGAVSDAVGLAGVSVGEVEVGGSVLVEL